MMHIKQYFLTELYGNLNACQKLPSHQWRENIAEKNLICINIVTNGGKITEGFSWKKMKQIFLINCYQSETDFKFYLL